MWLAGVTGCQQLVRGPPCLQGRWRRLLLHEHRNGNVMPVNTKDARMRLWVFEPWRQAAPQRQQGAASRCRLEAGTWGGGRSLLSSSDCQAKPMPAFAFPAWAASARFWRFQRLWGESRKHPALNAPAESRAVPISGAYLIIYRDLNPRPAICSAYVGPGGSIIC